MVNIVNPKRNNVEGGGVVHGDDSIYIYVMKGGQWVVCSIGVVEYC